MNSFLFFLFNEDPTTSTTLNGPFSNVNSRVSSEKNHRIINAAAKHEMNKYISETKHNSEIIIDLHIPEIKLLISDFEFLNDLYNCLVNDMLMWEPVMPRIVKTDQFHQQQYKINYYNKQANKTDNDNFQLCKSSLMKNLNEEDDEYENNNDDDKATNNSENFIENDGIKMLFSLLVQKK
jgi:hypothetical protein